jgi:hypothetical protein
MRSGANLIAPRQRDDSRSLHFVVERGSVSAMFHFEYSFDLEAITIAQRHGSLGKDNNAAANR